MGWRRYAIDALLSATVSFVITSIMPDGQKEEIIQEIKNNEKVVVTNSMTEEQPRPDNLTLYLVVAVIILVIIVLCQCGVCCRKGKQRRALVTPRQDETELQYVTAEQQPRTLN